MQDVTKGVTQLSSVLDMGYSSNEVVVVFSRTIIIKIVCENKSLSED